MDVTKTFPVIWFWDLGPHRNCSNIGLDPINICVQCVVSKYTVHAYSPWKDIYSTALFMYKVQSDLAELDAGIGW